MSTKKKKIKYGEVEISDEEFDPRNIKERITIFLDQDIVDHFRAEAKKEITGYQTLINAALRSYVIKTPIEKRLEIIEKNLIDSGNRSKNRQKRLHECQKSLIITTELPIRRVLWLKNQTQHLWLHCNHQQL